MARKASLAGLYRPGRFLSAIGCVGVGLLSLLAPLPAEAQCPLGVPVPDAIPASSTPVNGFLNPDLTLYGSVTGADASVDSSEAFMCTENGYILRYDMSDLMNPLLLADINTGNAGLTGLAVTPNGLTVSDDSSIYEGHIDGTAWVEDNIIALNGFVSNVLDLDWSPHRNQYFIATEYDGIRRVQGDGSTEEIGRDIGGAWPSLEIIDFLPGTYCNDMIEFDGIEPNFKNIDQYGDAEDWGTGHIDVNNGGIIQGMAYFNGGVAVVQGAGTHLHNEFLPFQPHIAPIVAPAILGDMNCDGIVDITNDLPLFVDALLDPTGYTPPPGCTIDRADMNQDQSIDGQDIPGFVTALTG